MDIKWDMRAFCQLILIPSRYRKERDDGEDVFSPTYSGFDEIPSLRDVS